ncbi:hypothetical protein ACQX2P_12045, partial [Corynebacterium diphtheriae]
MSTDQEIQKKILNVLKNLESNHEKTTLNLSDEDKLYISRMTDQIKRSNTHEIKVNIETDDNLSEFIKQKIDEKFDEKIPNLRTKQTMEQFKWSLMRIEDKQEILDDNIESVHKWATYFKSAL